MNASGAQRRAEIVSGAIGVFGIGLVVVSVLVWGAQGFGDLPASFARTPLSYVPLEMAALLYIVVGAMLAARVRSNPAGWLLLAMGLILASILPVNLMIAAAHESFRPAPPTTLAAAWMASSFVTPVIVGLGALAGLLFPDGRFLSQRWRMLAIVAIVAIVALSLSVGLEPSGLVWYPTLPNPLAAPAALEPLLFAVKVTSGAVLMGAILAVLAALLIRYRRGDDVTRAQLRWVVFAAVIQGLAIIPFIVTRYLITVSGDVGEVAAMVAQVGALMLPAAAAVAITRYHLFDIDVLIGRTLVYVPLMGALGGLYALSVTVFQRIFVALTGGTSDAALLIAVFLIAAAFTPLRKSLERLVSRWEPLAAGSTTPRQVPDGESDQAELQRLAAELLALRRLEARIRAVDGNMTGEASKERGAGAQEPNPGAELEGRSLAIDREGLVACPLGLTTSFTGCLGCPYLVALTVSPAAVRCRYGWAT